VSVAVAIEKISESRSGRSEKPNFGFGVAPVAVNPESKNRQIAWFHASVHSASETSRNNSFRKPASILFFKR
jgi:hypothetical protein